MTQWSFGQLVAVALVLAGVARGGDVGGPDAGRREFFEAKIRPVLAAHCVSCHGPEKQLGGLRVDWREPLRKGGENGPSVEPGKPDDSLIVRALDHSEPGLEMPKKAARLPADVVRDFRTWIADGAYDPRDRAPTADESARGEWRAKLAERRGWWSLRPVERPGVPSTADQGWPRGPVDRFILARLESKGLAPAPAATRPALARRASFVLTGLPPGVDDLRAFLDDPAPDPVAFARLVDRLLASPHYGERFARRWMDVVRFGDTYGYEWDIPAKGAWRFRDYLVRAFNADLPFDRFVREQVAGDLLPDPRVDPVLKVNESMAGPMSYQLGENRHGDSAEFDGIHQEMLHNKIDAFSKAFQGVTVGCARCHDHKLDAVSQRDYYALAGAFMSSRWVARTLDAPGRNAEALATLRDLKAPLRRAVAGVWKEAASRWPGEWTAGAESSRPWQKAVAAAGQTPAWEHPLRAWISLQKVVSDKDKLAAAWAKLKAEFAEEQRARVDHNAKTFRVVADFAKGVPPGWSVDGVGLRDGPGRPGDFTVALEGPSAVGMVLPGGLFTHALSPRLNGAVRSPYVRTLADPWLSVETCGGDFAAERTVVDNAFLTERQVYLARRGPAWSTYTPAPELTGRNVYREVATKTSNPNFPPRIGLGGACDDAQIADPRSWFGITRAVVHKAAGAPKDELSRFVPLFEGDAPSTSADVLTRYAVWLRTAVDRWGRDGADDDDATLINWLLDQGLLPNRSDDPAAARVRDLVAEYRKVERTVQDPQTVLGMADVDAGVDYRLNVRGEYAQFGPPVPRGYLGVFAGSDAPARFLDARSGRLELADRVASAGNPLTARVYVNRVWQWVFGEGLVSTPDDFGRLGSPPSHPELLDYLASEFVARGWSTRDLVRTLVTTATFGQSNAASPKALEVDPGDRLLHHYPLRRLEAEEVRDAVLAASGRLDRRIGGPPVDPNRPNEDPQKRLVSGPVDGLGRRSLYVKLTIMEPPRFLATFNQPPPKIPSGRRDVSSTPAQALTLLNDPFVLGQARFWGERLAAESGCSADDRLDAMFRAALGREPDSDELARWRGLVEESARDRDKGRAAGQSLASPEVWADVAHTLFNTKEFLYYR